MDNIAVIYKILKALEESMDYPEFDDRRISADRLGISEVRRMAILKMLKDRRLIEGISFDEDMEGNLYHSVCRIRITLAGLEYMEENSAMQRFAKMLKGIKDAIPGA